MKIISACFLLLFVLHITSLNSFAQTQSASSSVSGHVTLNGKGINRIVVGLRRDTSSSHSSETQTVLTNQDGEYIFNSLADGSYTVEIASTNQFAMTSPNTNYYRGGPTVVIENGGAISNIDFTLTRGGVITGIVKDSTGKPAIEAHITLTGVNEREGITFTSTAPLRNQSVRQTDDRGIYRIYGIPPGQYRVSAIPLQTNHQAPEIFHPSTKDAAKAVMIEIVEGAESNDVDITFPPSERNSTLILSGVVIDSETKKPASNVTVNYTRYVLKTSTDRTVSENLAFDSVQSDELGKFTFQEVVAGKYSIAADLYDEGKHSDQLLVEVANSDVEELELKLNTGLTIRGQIIVEGNKETNDLSRLTLSASASSRPISRSYRPSQATIQRNGSYEIKGLFPADVRFHLTDPDERYTLLRLEKNGIVFEETPQLKAGENLAGLNIVLTDGKGTIKGQAIFEGTKPDGICYNIVAERLGRPPGNTGYNGAVAEIDKQGRFFFDQLPMGDYELIADPEYIMFCGSKTLPKFPTVRQRVHISDKNEQRVTMVIKFENQ